MADDIQDQLVKAYLEYFKAHEWWVRKRSHRSYYETQKWLREIRRLARAKQDENKDYFQNVKQAKKDQEPE